MSRLRRDIRRLLRHLQRGMLGANQPQRVRQGVIGDWKFFLDNGDLFNLWARRFGESAVHALAEELRRLPWRVGRD